jgi:cytochrome c oxidase subunit III
VQPATVTAIPERDLTSTAILTTSLVLAAATMTFGAMIAVFFIRSQDNMFWGHLEIPVTLWLTTALLLAGSVTIEQGKRALIAGEREAGNRRFAASFSFGLAFLIGQVVAWVQVLHSGVVLKNNPHSWFIFLFIALHGLHIVLGLAGIGSLVLRTREPASGPRYQAKTRAIALGVSIFWHYLGFLWLVLFGLLLLWKR